MKLIERDMKIFREVERWRMCLGRHIRYLADFSSRRTCDNRLKMLLSENFLNRRIIIYGVPSVYTLTQKSKALIYASKRAEQVRLDQIIHDITVLDIAICFIKFLNFIPADLKTEKQLHQEDGFGERTHHPDFVFTKDSKTYCVEVELSLKSKVRLNKNAKSNFINYDVQIWVVGENSPKLSRLLNEFKIQYPNIEITNTTEVKNGIFKFIS
jgi:hypothetical protein